MEKQQTAVEYLAERMIRMIPTNSIVYEADVLMYIEQAKQMEKVQIEIAYGSGEDNIDNDGCSINRNGLEQYYNETYRTK
jgi:hypothetical protein